MVHLILVAALGLVPPSATPQPAQAEAPATNASPPAVRAQARQNLAAYVRGGDYDRSVWDVEGTVHFQLVVSPAGRVTDCRVVRSSGSAELDHRTCQIMRQRARFRPARNEQGEAVTDSVTASIGWFTSP